MGGAAGDARRHGAIPGRAGHKEGVRELNSLFCLNSTNLIYFFKKIEPSFNNKSPI